MKTFQVWVQGWRATGGGGHHYLKDEVEANSFQEACDALFEDDPDYDSEHLSCWACRLFDNASDAAKGFG